MQSRTQLRFLAISAIVLSLIFEVSAHSQMRCAKYDPASGQCYAPIRNQVASFLQEAYSWSSGMPVCQSPMGNLITDSYSNGASCPDYAGCPDTMGVYRPGETFTVMWFARNHAVENQAPGTVSLYLSPNEANNQGSDVSQATFAQGKFCEGPFMNCGGVNKDTTPCTLTCTMPTTLSSGIYTLWWKWSWQGGAMYSTCADVSVKSTGTQSTTGAAKPSTTAAPQPIPTPVPTPPATTAPAVPSTTAPAVPSTTAPAKPVTTAPAKPVTTAPAKPVTTAPAVPSTTGPSTPSTGSNGGSTTCANIPLVSSSSQATIVSVDSWGAGSSAMFRAVISIKASESVLSDWLLQFIFPSNAGNAKINSVVNAGAKLCESSSPVLHDMIQPASWAKQVASGESITIEVLGTNPAGLANSDLQNSVLKVFRRS